MKPYILLLLSLGIMAIALASCDKGKANCNNVVCTMEYRMISVRIVDANDSAVVLDDHFTIRKKTGDTAARFSGYVSPDNSYTVVGDEQTKNLYNSQEPYRFVGIKNGAVVVDEEYIISADCCHISKVSGKGKVIVQ